MKMKLINIVLFLCLCVTCFAGRADPELDNAIDASVANLKLSIATRTQQAKHVGLSTTADDLWIATAYKNIGMMIQSKGIHLHLGGDRLQREALDNYNLALAVDNGRTESLSIQILYLKGLLLKMMGMGQESLDCLVKLEKEYTLSEHDQSFVYFQKGDTLQMIGKTEEAVENFHLSLQLRPCKTTRYYQYVQACKDIRSLTKQDWLNILNEIQLKLKECENKSNINQLGNSDFLNEDEDEEELDINGLEVLAKFSKASPHSRNTVADLPSYLTFDDVDTTNNHAPTVNSGIYYALYIAAEKAQRYALAWWYLEHANNLEKSLRSVKFSRNEAVDQGKQVLQAFTPDLLNSLAYMKGKASKVPIFIVGFMRSGSTLLETMLDSHSRIWGMGEDSIFNANLTDFRNALVSTPPGLPDTALSKQQHLYSTLSKYGKRVVKEMRALAVERDASSVTYSTDSGATITATSELKNSENQKKTTKSTKTRKVAHIVDKMLFNYRNIGFLHMVFPDALILHTMRDPMDTLFSCYRCKFDDAGLEWSLDGSDLALQYKLYLEIMQHFRTVLPGRVMDIRYEDLVRDPEAIMREIIERRLGLSWEPAVLEFHRNNRTVQTHSQSQVKQELYSHSIGAWTRYQHQLEPMANELRKYLPKLKKAGALPGINEMNWELSPDFDYESMKRKSVSD